MDAIVIAGGTPQPGEPLYQFTQGQPKAFLDLCGKPMAQWVLDALTEAETVDRIVITGLDPTTRLSSPKLVSFLPNAGGLLQNMQAGARWYAQQDTCSAHVCVASSDIPGIQAEHVNWVVNTAMQTDLDAYYTVLTRQVMEQRYPGSNRTYLRLKDAEMCGGDLNVLRTKTLTANNELWNNIINSRKNPFKQAALIGYWTLILVLLRRLTVADAVERVAQRLQLTGTALVCPYAELGMDVDKPHQLDMMRADLDRRSRLAA